MGVKNPRCCQTIPISSSSQQKVHTINLMRLQFTDELLVDFDEGFIVLFVLLQYLLGCDGGLTFSHILRFNTIELQKTKSNNGS